MDQGKRGLLTGEYHAAALNPGTNPALRAPGLARLSMSGVTEMRPGVLYYNAPTSPAHAAPVACRRKVRVKNEDEDRSAHQGRQHPG